MQYNHFMSKDKLQIPETVESLRADILDLKNKIFRRNLVNNVDMLTLPFSSEKLDEILGQLPEVMIIESSISEGDQKDLPFMKKAFGGNIHEKLAILPYGMFGGDNTELGYQDDEVATIHDVLERFAIIKRPLFRVIVDEGWKQYYITRAGDSEKVYEDADRYLTDHEFGLLKELRTDMEAALGRISPDQPSLDS